MGQLYAVAPSPVDPGEGWPDVKLLRPTVRGLTPLRRSSSSTALTNSS